MYIRILRELIADPLESAGHTLETTAVYSYIQTLKGQRSDYGTHLQDSKLNAAQFFQY
jgi:hypothetical protein